MLSLFVIPYAWLSRRWSSSSAAGNGKKSHHHDQPHFEFGGPLGAIAMLIFLPVTVFALYFGCNADQCVSLNPLSTSFLHVSKNPFAGHTLTSFFYKYLYSPEAIVLYLAWFALHIVLYFILPCKTADGVALDAKGTKLKYPLNGQLKRMHFRSARAVYFCFTGAHFDSRPFAPS